MNLADYLAATGTTQQDMATAIGRSQSVVSRIMAGIQLPEPSTALAIVKATKGMVTLCDLFYQNGPCKRECHASKKRRRITK